MDARTNDTSFKPLVLSWASFTCVIVCRIFTGILDALFYWATGCILSALFTLLFFLKLCLLFLFLPHFHSPYILFRPRTLYNLLFL